MPARVDDVAVIEAAHALLTASETVTNSQGLRLKPMTIDQAKQHVMCALVYSLGHYANSLQPTGWTEIKEKP